MAVPFDRLTSEVLDNYGTMEAYDNLRAYDGIIEAFGRYGGIVQELGGGPSFKERVLYGQNTNVAFRSKTTQVDTNDDDGYTMASVTQRVISGAVVWNQVEADQVAEGSKWAIANLMQDKVNQFSSTWVQVVATALRQATPGANDPFTLLPDGNTGTVNGILIDRTPAQQATDAATTAGISRGDNSWWRNQYSNTSYDLTTVAGRGALYADVYAPCVRGAGGLYEPNVAPCHAIVLGDLGASADNNRRGATADGSKAKFGYDSIMFYNAELIRDSSARFLNGTAGKVTFLSVGPKKALVLKFLKGQGGVKKEMLDQRNNLGSVPIFWKHKAHSDINSLNWVSIGYCVMSLVPKGLQDMGLADNIA